MFFGTMMFLRGSGGPRFTSGAHLRGSFLTQGVICPKTRNNLRPRGSEGSWIDKVERIQIKPAEINVFPNYLCEKSLFHSHDIPLDYLDLLVFSLCAFLVCLLRLLGSVVSYGQVSHFWSAFGFATALLCFLI